MKRFLFSAIFALTLSAPALAIYQIGDQIPNLCWDNSDGGKSCLDDAKASLRVLLFSAGWCGGCKMEIEGLVPQLSQFDGKPVVFISLSTEGWEPGDAADVHFLKEWKEKLSIPFPVAASPGDAGKSFFDPANYLPRAVIIGKDGKLAVNDIEPIPSASPMADAIVQAVNKLLD